MNIAFIGTGNMGLPMLAQGSDPKLKDLSQKDLATPADADGRVATAQKNKLLRCQSLMA